MSTKKNTIDITKSGPMTFRQLQDANNDPFSGVRPQPISQFDINRQAEQEVSSPLAGTTTPWGQSMWDNKSASAEDFQNLGDIRANNQPWYAQAAAGVAKGAITAGTTFVSGVLGIPYGIEEAIRHGELSKLWDNEVTNTAAELTEQAEEWLPNYYTREQQEGPWYSSANLLSANFLFDKVIKNIGFTVGAAYSGGIYSKLINGVAKGIGGLYSWVKTGKNAEQAMELGARAMAMSGKARVTKALVGAGFSAMGEGAIEAINNSKDYVNIERQKIDALTTENYNNAFRDFIYNGGTVDEQGNPVLDNSNNSRVFQERVRQIQTAAKQANKEIDNTRTAMGNADFLANIPILTMGNLLTFGKMFAGGYKAARNTSKVTTRATKEAMAAAKAEGKEAVERLDKIVDKAKKTGYQGLTDEEKALVEEGTNHLLGPKMNAFMMAVREPLKEGNEEMAQSAVAKAPQNYYGSRVDAIYDAALDNKSKDQVLNWWQAYLQGFKDIYGDFNNYEEGFIGALTGMFGSPTFGKKNNSTSETYLGRSKWIGMSGGVVPQWRNAIKGRENEAQIVSHVNSILKSGNLERDVKHLIAQTTFDERQRVAAIRGDKLDYKDSELASIFENIMYLKEAGKLDLLSNAISTMDGFTEEDADKIIQLTQKELGVYNSNLSSLNKYIDEKTKRQQALQESIESSRRGLEEYKQSAPQISIPLTIENTGTIINTSQYTSEAQQKITQAEDNIKEQEEELQEVTKTLEQLQALKDKQNPVKVSPYLKQDGSIMSSQEVLEDLNKRKEKHKDILKFVTDSIDSIDAATEETLTNEQLKTLTWYKTLMHDWKNRANNMSQDMVNVFDKILRQGDIAGAIEEIDNLIQGIEPEELNAQDKVAYGGLTVQRRFLKGRLKNLTDVRELLSNILSKNDNSGLALARAFANNKEITVGEGKEAKKVKTGDYLYDFIANMADSLNLSEDEKMAFSNNLKDLKKIGENYNTYNKLLTDYINHPEKIDEAHAASTAQAEAENKRNRAARTTNNIRFDGTVGATAKDIRDNKDGLDEDGVDGWFETLTDEQKEKYKEASKLAKGIDGLNHLADEEEDEKLSQLLNAAIDKNIEDVNNLSELLDKLKKDESLGEELDKLIEDSLDDVAKLDEKEKLEAAFRDFINSDEVNKLTKSLDAQEKANTEKVESALVEQSKAMDRTEEEKEKELKEPKEKSLTPPSSRGKKGKGETLADRRKSKKKGKGKGKKTDNVIDTKQSVEEDKKEVEGQGSANDVSKRKERKRRIGYSTEYSNRPQLSETFMYGRNLESYVNYIKEHPERIPKFTSSKLFPNIKNQEDFNAAYIRYIEATHKYLTEQGAFEYVKHNLKANDKIIFTIDKDLNEAAEVPVVVIKAIDKDGNSHVVGTMKSELDFMSVNFRTDKTYGETESAQKALYDDIVNKYKASTIIDNENFIGAESSVSALMGGDVAFSDNNSTVFRIFEGTGSNVIFGVVREENGNLIIRTGNAEQDKKILNVHNGKKGQVYVLIPANNGSLLPALCYGTSLLELLSKDNDWYIDQIIKAIQDIPAKLQDASNKQSLGNLKANLAKWLGVNADNLHINLAFRGTDGKDIETLDLTKADRVIIKYSLNSSDDKIVSTVLLNDDKAISAQKALNAVTRIVSEVAKSGDPELQVNLNFTELAKDSSRNEYNLNMAKYYHTNIVQGQTHTVNDWFTYDKTDIEKENSKTEPRRKRPSSPAPVTRTPRPARKVATNKGSVEVSSGGQVTNEKGETLVDREKEEALKGESKPKEESETSTQKKPEEATQEKGDKDDNTNDNSSTENTGGSTRIDNDDSSLLENSLLGGGRRKSKSSNKGEDKQTTSDSTESSTEAPLAVPGQHRRKARTRNRKAENNSTEESGSTESSSSEESTTNTSTREKFIKLADALFSEEDGTNPIRPLIDKIFDAIDNNRGIHNIVESIGLVAKVAKGVITPVFNTTSKIYDYLVSNILDDFEKRQLEQEAAREFNIAQDVDALDKISFYVVNAIPIISGRIKTFKSKVLSKLLDKVNSVVKALSENPIVTQNFFNRVLSCSSTTIIRPINDLIKDTQSALSTKYSFKALSDDVKELLTKRGLTEETYNSLSSQQKEAIVRCTI